MWFKGIGGPQHELGRWFRPGMCGGLIANMRSQKNVSPQKALVSADIVCPQCQAQIESSQLQRVSFQEIQCPLCDAIFMPQEKQSNQG